jgi:hypothetical protein
MNAWRADPLFWGHGPRVFQVFLEPTCPFSIRAFGKLEDLLDKAGEDRITVKVSLQSQPWHMYSGVIVRCILAPRPSKAQRRPRNRYGGGGPHGEEFEFDRHCSGPNLDATPNDIIRRIEGYSGVKLAEGIVKLSRFGRDDVQRARLHATAVALRHCAAASDRKIRRVERETRCR